MNSKGTYDQAMVESVKGPQNADQVQLMHQEKQRTSHIFKTLAIEGKKKVCNHFVIDPYVEKILQLFWHLH